MRRGVSAEGGRGEGLKEAQLYTPVMEQKSDLRRAIKERLTRMSENDRRVESQIIVRELEKLTKDAKIVCAYLPFIDEPDIRPLLSDRLKHGKIVGMPHQEGIGMKMYRIESLEEVGKNETTRIPEPPKDEPLEESEIDVIIVPGRAFTKDGKRLGRGNGGYDRWIESLRTKNTTAKLIGVCFEAQIVQEVPLEPHDRLMDVVLTPTKIFLKA